MRIAIIGSGISSLYAAYRLAENNQIVVFEANDYVGGHTATVPVEVQGKQYAIDTGFIVFNDRTYPNFISLLSELNVASQPTDMSFGIRNDKTGLEYRASDLNTFFAQRKNIVRPRVYQLLWEAIRLRRALQSLLGKSEQGIPLGHFLERENYSQNFIDNFIVPMGAAIWSADTKQLLSDFPAHFFAEFFHNHGFLNPINQPRWRVVKGGSSSYIPKLTEKFADQIRVRCPVERVRRTPEAAYVQIRNQPEERFDAVVIGTHSDQALRMLSDPTPQESQTLGAFRYQENDVLLHTDDSILPKSRRAWAAWNYHVMPKQPGRAVVSYWMNLLQGIDAPVNFLVTLNRKENIQQDKVLRHFRYSHPVFSQKATEAQSRQREICGANRTYFCGAYWGYGFHEDGVNSARVALEAFGTGKLS